MNLSLKRLLTKQHTAEHSLPIYASIYFENLIGKYRSLDAADIPTESKSKLDGIAAKKSNGSTLTWEELYTFDLLLARLLPSVELPRKVWNLRNRYRDVAGMREYDAYLASRPPDYLAGMPESGERGEPTGEGKSEKDTPTAPAPSTATQAALRADVEFLLAQIHLRYAIRPAWEQEREFVSRFVAVMTGVGLLWLILYTVFIHYGVMWQATTLTVVLFVGMMGGLVSIQQRYQSASDEGDPVHNISVLRWSGFGVLVSPITGALFASIFYIVFAAGLVQGSLFPVFQTSGTTSGLFAFFEYATPTVPVDYAKLIVWSFIAGFFERLVPDTLSRFVTKQAMIGQGSA